MNYGLTPEQVARRRYGIGGSDAGKIMAGEWQELWEIKTGKREPEDLSDVFRVQLGHVTEKFNLSWLLAHHKGLYDMDMDVELLKDTTHDFIRCFPDALAYLDGNDDVTRLVVIDAKHSNQYVDEAYMAKTYYWQLMHNAYVTKADLCCISPIYGNEFGEPIIWAPDPEDTARMIEAEVAFWWNVMEDVAPGEIDAPVAAPALPAIDDMRTVDMDGNNEWASLAADHLKYKEGAGLFEKSKKGLKALVEPDVREASGYGVIAKRAKDNSIRFSIDKNYKEPGNANQEG